MLCMQPKIRSQICLGHTYIILHLNILMFATLSGTLPFSYMFSTQYHESVCQLLWNITTTLVHLYMVPALTVTSMIQNRSVVCI